MLISSGLSSVTVGSIILFAGKSFVTESVKYGFDKALEDHKEELYQESKIFEIDYSMMQQERFEVMNDLYVKYLALEEATLKFLGSSPPSYSEIKSGDWRHTEEKEQLDSIKADFSRALERSRVYFSEFEYKYFKVRRLRLALLCNRYACVCSFISMPNFKDERDELLKELDLIYEEDLPDLKDHFPGLFRQYLDPDEKKRNQKK